MKDAGILPSSNQANKILHRAVIYGKADAVRELLSAGVPITGESKPKGEIEMWTPSGSLLDDVARYSNGSTSGKEVIAALLENPSVRANKPDLQRALGKAASEGQVEIVRMLIAAGADPQASFQDTYNADEKPADQTFLMRAVESGVWSMIDDALSSPHDIHAVDHDGHSALAVFVWTSPPVEDIFPIVDKLIADGADKKEMDRALADACDRAEWRDGLVCHYRHKLAGPPIISWPEFVGLSGARWQKSGNSKDKLAASSVFQAKLGRGCCLAHGEIESRTSNFRQRSEWPVIGSE